MSAVRPRIHLRALSPRAIVLAAVSVAVVAAAAFGWLGWRLVQQDEALAAQRAQERLETAADLVASAMARSLLGIDADLGAWLNGSGEPAQPSALAAEVASDREAVLVRVRAGDSRVTSTPPDRLLFDPAAAPDGAGAADPHAVIFARGDRLEFVDRNYDAALRAFADIARMSSGDVRAAALVRRARAERKADRTAAALSTYAELADLQDARVDGRPARLLAMHATCGVLEAEGRKDDLSAMAAGFHEAIYSGRWLLPRSLFDLYAADAARWRTGAHAPSGEDAESGTRRRLTDAVAWILAARASGGAAAAPSGRLSVGSGDAAVVVAWHAASGALAVLAAPPAWIERRRAPDIAPALARAQATLTLSDPAGQIVRGEPPPARTPLATRDGTDTDLPWTIRVVSSEPPATSRDRRMRRIVFAAGLGCVALVLIGASYAAARAVVRELEAARMQSEFVATVSHEFRTPLSAIRHVSDLLAEGRVREEGKRQRYYQALQAESERLQRLIETLLDFRRMEDGAHPYHMEPCNTSALLADVAARFGAEAALRGYVLETAVAAGLPPVMGDAAALTLAVWNLLDNAVKYSPSCKTVRLEARAEDAGVAIAVSDCGIGIAADEQPRVFARFTRGASAAASGAGGTGLGLAIVRHIVDAHRGDIGLQSTPGVGTTLTITLPAAPQSWDPPSAGSGQASAS